LGRKGEVKRGKRKDTGNEKAASNYERECARIRRRHEQRTNLRETIHLGKFKEMTLGERNGKKWSKLCVVTKKKNEEKKERWHNFGKTSDGTRSRRRHREKIHRKLEGLE